MPRPDRAEDHLGLEIEPAPTRTKREGLRERVAAEAAVGVEEGPLREPRDEMVRDPVREAVCARCSGAHEITDAEDERRVGRAREEDARRGIRGVLSIGIDREPDPHPSIERGLEAGAQRGTLASVRRVGHEDASLLASDPVGPVARAIVDDVDRVRAERERCPQAVHDGAQGRFCVERRDDHAGAVEPRDRGGIRH